MPAFGQHVCLLRSAPRSCPACARRGSPAGPGAVGGHRGRPRGPPPARFTQRVCTAVPGAGLGFPCCSADPSHETGEGLRVTDVRFVCQLSLAARKPPKPLCRPLGEWQRSWCDYFLFFFSSWWLADPGEVLRASLNVQIVFTRLLKASGTEANELQSCRRSLAAQRHFLAQLQTSFCPTAPLYAQRRTQMRLKRDDTRVVLQGNEGIPSTASGLTLQGAARSPRPTAPASPSWAGCPAACMATASRRLRETKLLVLPSFVPSGSVLAG